jgi:sugar lactone lactonase YvrE
MFYCILLLICSSFLGLFSQTVKQQTPSPCASPNATPNATLNATQHFSPSTSQALSLLRLEVFPHPAAKMFNSISAIVYDAQGSLLVADGGDNRIYKLLANGEVRIIAGGKRGYADGKAASAEFISISDITLNAKGEIFVLDGQRVRKILPNGVVTTLAGFPLRGKTDGRGTEARFNMPLGIAVANDGCVFLADAGNQSLRMIQPNGHVRTLPFTFAMPSALAFDTRGRLLVLDRVEGIIHRLTPRTDTSAEFQKNEAFDDSVLIQFPQYIHQQSNSPQTPPILNIRLNVRLIVLSRQGDIFLLETAGTLVQKLSFDGVQSTIWRGSAEEISVSAMCADKNGDIVLANTRNGALYKLVQGKSTNVHESKNLKNMTQSQTLMTKAQFLMTTSSKMLQK